MKLAKSGGVVTRSRELRQQARKLRVEEYFFGCLKVRLCVCVEEWGAGRAAAALCFLVLASTPFSPEACSALHKGMDRAAGAFLI